MDQEFSLDTVKDLEKFEDNKYQGLNLNIGNPQNTKTSSIEKSEGVVEAVKSKREELWSPPKREPIFENKESLKSEREKMLELIKMNKKVSMDQMEKTSKDTTTDILRGIGNGILDDLEMSIHQTRHRDEDNEDQIEEKKSHFDISEDKKIGDSTFDAFNGSKF